MPGRYVHPEQSTAPILVENRLDEWLAQKQLRSGISHAGKTGSAIDKLGIAQYVQKSQ
jgi:hypothetical protein